MFKKNLVVFIVMICGVSTLFSETPKEPSCDFPLVDKKLNSVYKEVLLQYANDTLFLSRLKDAQRIWLKFRDAHVESRFPTAKKGNQYAEYGSIYPQCACIELTSLTLARIAQLEMWIKGTVEGDVCGGSLKTR